MTGGGPRTESKARETMIREREALAKRELAEVVPMVERLSPEEVDEDLVRAVDHACETAERRVAAAKGGTERMAKKKAEKKDGA